MFSFNINILSWSYTFAKREYKGTVQIDSHRTPIRVNLLLGKRVSCEMENSVPEQMKNLTPQSSFAGSCGEFNRAPSSAAEGSILPGV